MQPQQNFTDSTAWHQTARNSAHRSCFQKQIIRLPESQTCQYLAAAA
ncbi:hypothetical protein HMPREF9371_1170 [Neisseria shayeganii 871]|uniref:Uncharacterized protein n=1 Tax=Neisseria shayeganii 871 TaxID=1032488 RepID=G4CHT1_9NEIS|nr:hypothetical protein HMPREF9371_1170 [Neisseria shayeganii 871]